MFNPVIMQEWVLSYIEIISFTFWWPRLFNSIYVDVDHEMELDNPMISERRIVKLLEDSALSDTVCDDGEQESRSDRPNRPALNTPQSGGILARSATSAVRESHGSASVSAYEDALAELSSTKTPVLPTRNRATPLRRSARKIAQSAGDRLLSLAVFFQRCEKVNFSVM